MQQLNESVQSDRKVTLSCRVLPEQKLMIAERANEMDMSTAQYVEAKVLRKDVFPLEKKIETQRAEIESLKVKLFRMERDKNEELVQLKGKYKGKIKTLQSHVEETKEENGNSIRLTFSNSKQLESFIEKLNRLNEKYQFKSNLYVLRMCVDYTLKNDGNTFFLERVSDFYNDNYKA